LEEEERGIKKNMIYKIKEEKIKILREINKKRRKETKEEIKKDLLL